MIEDIEKYAKENNVPIMMKDGIEYLCKYIEDNNIKSILEIGSAIGYSAIKMALINNSIKVTTIEKDIERYNIAINNIKKFNLDNQIDIYNMDALDYVPTKSYDLIFIDAAKGKNITFFNLFKDYLNDGGSIITDNLSFHGLVENPKLVKTKNQKGIVRHINNYIEFLNNNNEFITTYIPCGDKIAISKRRNIMNNILVMPGNKEDIDILSKSSIKGLILHIKGLSRSSNILFDKEEIKDITLKYKDIEINVCINKILLNEDIDILKDTLIYLDNINISKIFFYDIAVFKLAKELGINKDLVIYQDHLNASIMSHNYYNKRGIKYSFITNDITYNEINDIINNTNMNIILEVYGYVPMFSSKRNLVKSYFDYLDKDIKNNIYYMMHDNEKYIVLEEDDGTSIYSKKINIINYLSKLDKLSYIVINGFDINTSEILDVINGTGTSTYTGFIDKETIYKVGDSK